MKTISLLVLLSVAVSGQVVPNRYVLELSGEPAASAGVRATARIAARAAVRQSQVAARAAVAAKGGAVIENLDTVFNGLIVNIPDARSAELMSIPGAVKVHPVRRVRPLLTHALPLHKVPDAWNLLPLGQAGAGAGIKIGMIDSGVDVNNPAFGDLLPPVDGFPKVRSAADTRFTNAKIIVARNYTPLLPDGGDADANDHDGHGTGTALAAAGGTASTPYGVVTGVAPKAYIGSYKVLDANGGTSDVIAKAIDDAVADGMDVINISLGSYVTSYSDIDPGEVGMAAIARAAKAGVIVVVAAGNQGPAAGTIADYASAPDAITVGAIHNDRSLGYGIEATGIAPYPAYAGDGPNPGQAIGGTLFDLTALDPSGLACAALPEGSVAGKIVLVLRGTCTFESKLNDAAAGGALGIVVYNNPGNNSFSTGGVTVGSATLPALFVNQSDGLDLKARAAQDGGLQVTLDFSGAIAFPARTDVSSFSSRGPSLGSALKPDLAAVGEEIVTGAQNSFSGGESYSASGFVDTAGTSFSAPLAAGAAAVLKGARPGLTGQQYRSLLVNGAAAATVSDGVAATASQAGAGILNLLAAVSGTVAAYPTSLNFGTGNTTVALSLLNVSPALDTFTLRAVPAGSAPAPVPAAATVVLDAGASQQVALTLDAAGLAPGEYSGYVTVSGTASSTVAKIPYWFAVPGGDPVGISLLYQDYYDAVRTSSTQAVVLRIVDAAGLPYTGALRPSLTVAGSGSVRSFYRTGTIPGTYAVDIRTGTANMELTFTIGSITETVVIPVY
uniref:Peptidase S8 and S53, subtilisin, kexin, sedolisin n=1 Tax=Solibacter usitatus (strain Ellin6076) TaxID=234267 RepID=Q01TA9_SOLUE